ncbi:hypothetical protein AHAS_Ahas10G0106900 [Arachis hypogaea]
MSFLASIPRQQLAPANVLVACRWSYHPRTKAWMSRSVASIRHDINYMDEFVWRPYIDIITPVELHAHFDVCDTIGPLLSFEFHLYGWVGFNLWLHSLNNRVQVQLRVIL